nr:hypothetical protein [Tanacetum cinerariifolium]
MQQKIERLHAQLGDLKGKSKDYVQKDNIRGTSTNTKFAKQSILGKPPKVGEIHALSKTVTSNSIPTPQESKVVKNDKVVALGMFRINPFKTSREEKHVTNNVRASARIKPITVSQPPVITKKDLVLKVIFLCLQRELCAMVVSSSLTILLNLPEDIYAAVDSCETAQEISLRVQQMMKGSDIGIQEKAKLFNEWERFTSNEGESIESYYHRFLKLMNDLKRNKHFPEKIASNLKFLNNLQPEWSRHVTIVHQTKDLHTADYTQLYDFLKYNQKERISSNPKNRQIAQPGMNMGQDRQMQMVGGNGGNQFRQYAGHNAGNLAGYNDVIGNQVIQNAVQNPRIQNVGNQNGLIGVQWNGNQNQIGNGNLVATHADGNADGKNENQIRCYNCMGVGHYARNCTVRPRRRVAAYLQTQLLIAQNEEAGIQLQAEEYDLIAVAANLDEIKKVNANCILMA